MNREELGGLLADLESDRVERTVSTSNTDKFGEAICAFANDLAGNRLPGYLFVGAKEDGTASGAAITDQLLQNLGAIRSDGNLLPQPVMTVQKWALGGGEMAVVEVLPSDMPPVRYKQRVWVRVGPRKATAIEAEERLLAERRAALAKTWDARPEPEATLADLTLDLFAISYRPRAVSEEVIAENHRSVEEQLAALRFFDLRAGLPTHAGVLLFAKDPVYFYAGAYAQYVRYDGTHLSDPVLRDRRVRGDLLTVLRDLDSLAGDLAGARPVAVPGKLHEREVFDYPPRALHELLMNAVIHRSYESTTPVRIQHFEDRLEISNPGGLYGDLSAREFPTGTAYRNPIVAEAARVLGFVNRYGRGIDLAQSALAQNGSPPARFALHPNHVLVTVERRA